MALRFVGVKNKEFRYLHCILTWIVSDFQKKTLHVKIERKGEMFSRQGTPSLEVTRWGLVGQSWLTLCGLMDCCLPGSSVHGMLQARVLEWVAIPFSRASS